MARFEDRSPCSRSIHVPKSEDQCDGNVMALGNFRNKMGALKFASLSSMSFKLILCHQIRISFWHFQYLKLECFYKKTFYSNRGAMRNICGTDYQATGMAGSIKISNLN